MQEVRTLVRYYDKGGASGDIYELETPTHNVIGNRMSRRVLTELRISLLA